MTMERKEDYQMMEGSLSKEGRKIIKGRKEVNQGKKEDDYRKDER